MIDSLFTHGEPPPAKDGPPPPTRCGYPLDEHERSRRRCRKVGHHSVLIGTRKANVIRNGVCEGHLKDLLNGLADAGLSYELL